MLLGWAVRVFMMWVRVFAGVAAVKPTGGAGAVFAVIWMLLTAAVIIRSGALSTIVGFP